MVELGPREFPKAKFIETASGNRVSRESTLCGSQNIMLNGRTVLEGGCVLRGDLANIRIGRFCSLGRGTRVRPALKRFAKGVAFVPVHVGDYVVVEEDCVVRSAVVGSFVHLGRGCVLGERSVLKDCVEVLPGTVVPDDAVVPSFSLLGGSPARVLDTLPPSTQELLTAAATQTYHNFRPAPDPAQPPVPKA